MAIVKLGELIVGLRGTIQGLTFSANGSSPYVRKYAAPASRRTVKQSGKRAWFSEIRRQWGTLNPAQIAAWDALGASPPEEDYNSLGERVYLSGSAWHLRVNMRRLQAGQGINNSAPPNTSVSPPSSLSMTIYDSSDLVSDSVFNYGVGDFVGAYAVLHVSPSLSSVRNVQTTGYYVIWCGSVSVPGPEIMTAELVGAFGYLSEGQKVFGQLRKQSLKGIRSTAVLATTLVLPPV